MSKNLIDINSEELYKIIKSRIKNQLSENKKKKNHLLMNIYIHKKKYIVQKNLYHLIIIVTMSGPQPHLELMSTEKKYYLLKY